MEVSDSESSTSIGKQLAQLRVFLNMTQQQFADAMCTSRITINKMEHSEKITTDFGYKIYYATDKIVGNKYIPEYIRQYAKILKQRVEREVILIERNDTKFNPILYDNIDNI